MTEPRSSRQHTTGRLQETHDGAATPKREAVSTGRAAYREEFQRDYGPDLDESLDRTESGQEF